MESKDSFTGIAMVEGRRIFLDFMSKEDGVDILMETRMLMERGCDVLEMVVKVVEFG